MRISSQEWRRDRWFDGLLFALLAHGVAIAALGVVAGRHSTQVEPSHLVPLRERAEHLRFVAPTIEPMVPRTLAHSDARSRRPLTSNPPREAPAPVRDTGAAIVTSPAAIPSPAVMPATGLLASALPVDHRLLVGPAVAGGVADMRVRKANAFIASRVRAHLDSVRRDNAGWTVGDSTLRFGFAKGCIALGKFCLPFGFTSVANPAAPAFIGVDRARGDDAEVGAAIDRVRAMNSRP